MKTANAITLNHKNRTIEVTKKFYTAASKYNSEEELLLREAQQNNPGYKVEVISRKTKSTYKGLDYEFMTTYIKAHDDAEKYSGYGNNPQPISQNPKDRCCDACNKEVVIVERLMRHAAGLPMRG